MRHVMLRSALGSSLLLLGLTASAQYPPRTGDQYSSRDMNDYHAQLFDRIRADLDGAQTSASSFNGDIDRIATVRDQVGAFQRRMDGGYFDERELTSAIVSLQKVLDNNPLYDQTRDRLVMDLSRLRDLRSGYEH